MHRSAARSGSSGSRALGRRSRTARAARHRVEEVRRLAVASVRDSSWRSNLSRDDVWRLPASMVVRTSWRRSLRASVLTLGGVRVPSDHRRWSGMDERRRRRRPRQTSPRASRPARAVAVDDSATWTAAARGAATMIVPTATSVQVRGRAAWDRAACWRSRPSIVVAGQLVGWSWSPATRVRRREDTISTSRTVRPMALTGGLFEHMPTHGGGCAGA